MERLLPTELLTLAKKARADFFDEEIAQKLAQQSQFEKQMVTKLLQVRRERVVVEDNFWMARDVMKELLETVKAASAPEEASPLANNAEKLIFKERTLSFYKWMLAEQRKEAAEENLRICEEVVSVLVDLALHSADYREITEGEVPQRVMDEWNTMIFANYPLLDMTDQEELVERLEKLEKLKNLSVFGEDEDSMWASSNLCKQLAKEAALDRVAVREYIDLKGRWDPRRCEKDLDLPSESGVRVLGHVVHRLLLLRYPFKALPEAAKLPPRTVAAALLGVRDPRSRRVLRRLLEAQRVLLVEPEAAVADCVERFQQENVPEDTEDEITEAPAKSIEEEKEPTPPKPDRSSKKPSKKSSKPLAAQSQRQSVMLEKEVQAPPLPEEEGAGPGAGAAVERVLAASPSARGRLGRVLVEQLAAGRHLTPEMLVQAIVRHLEARLDGKWRGWVLLDMPRTHAQALHLEQHLTGQPVPPAPDEEWARHPLRTLTPFVFEDELEAQREVEDFLRQSQIFPNPTPPEVPRVFLPYLTMVVTARHEHCKTIRSNESATEVCPDHASFVEKLYANVGLSYSFYYRRLDLAALKFLARALLYSLGDDYDVEEKWKELLDELQKEMGSLKEFSPSDLKKRVMRENFVFEHLRRTSVEPEVIVKGLMTDMTSAQFGPIAGQYGWIYADMELKDVGCVLAKSWEAAEGEYLRGLAEVLTLLRGHSTAAAPFMQGTRAAVRRLLEAPEPKQTPADIFQLQLGELTPEMREDPEVKAEWHLRAVELRQQLCDICERHRHDAEAARRTIATDIWIAVELAFVANLMIMMAQLELNFFASALQVIQDYYLTMLEKPLHTDKLPRYTLSRMELSEVLKPPPEPGAGAGEAPPPGGSKTASKDSSPSGSRASQLAPPSTSRPSTRRSTSVSVTGAAGGPRASGRPSRVREGTGGGSLSGATHSGRPSVTRGIIDTTAVALAAVLLQPPAPEEAGDSAGSSAIVSQQSSTASPTPPHQSISAQPQQPPVASPGSASTVESGGNGARASVETPPPATATSIVTPVHAFVTDALAAAAAKMDALAGAAADVQRREGSASGKARAAASPDKAGEPDQRPSGKGKKPNSTAAASLDGATSTAPPTEEPEPMPEPERAVQEWAAAVATLHQRALFRLQLIECRAHLQFGDFLTDIFALFHGLHDEINGRYDREVAAVDMLIDILQLTIEDEEPIGAQLVLEGDGLFMRPDRLMAKPFAPLDIPLASLDAVQSRISIAQLAALSKRLQGLAPSGLMAERALLEQLVELTSISAGDGDNRPLPPTWEALGPLGLQALLERVFGKAEVVDWRDLIIRCLEVPWPTERQILEQREKYAEHDPNRLELLSSDIFLSVELWFEAQECEEEEEEEEEVDRIPKIKKLLQMLFKGFNELVNYTAMLLHFCKDAEPVAGLGKALALATGCRVVKNERDERAMKQEALRPLGRRLASFEKEARDVATCAVERLVGDAVRASESPYLAWLPDEHRAAVWKALLGDEPCQPPGPTPAPSPSSPPIPTPTPPGTPSYPSRGSDAADVVQGLFGGFFKKPPQSPQQRGSAKKPGKDHEAQLYVHDYMEMPIRVVLEESRENIKEKDVKTPENESAHEGFEDLMDSPIIPSNDTTPDETGEEAKEEEESDERVSLGDYDEKSPWLTQLPFDLVLAVLSSALSGLIRTPPPILLGRKAESYPLFRGLIDLLTCIYSELGEDQLNKWTVSSMKLMGHPLLQELLSFTTLHFVAGSVVETVWSILNEYGLEVLTPTPLNA